MFVILTTLYGVLARWKIYTLNVAVIDNTGNMAAMPISVNGRNQTHATNRITSRLHATLPAGWVAGVDTEGDFISLVDKRPL